MAENDRRNPYGDLPITTTGQLAVFLGGSATSFTGLLLVLISKADPGNKAKLRLAFPEAVLAYDTWMAFDTAPTWDQLKAAFTA